MNYTKEERQLFRKGHEEPWSQGFECLLCGKGEKCKDIKLLDDLDELESVNNKLVEIGERERQRKLALAKQLAQAEKVIEAARKVREIFAFTLKDNVEFAFGDLLACDHELKKSLDEYDGKWTNND